MGKLNFFNSLKPCKNNLINHFRIIHALFVGQMFCHCVATALANSRREEACLPFGHSFSVFGLRLAEPRGSLISDGIGF